MPWKPSDAERHTKAADTDDKRELWADVANERLEACLADIESPSDEQRSKCEASAIRQANSVLTAEAAVAASEAATLKTLVQRLMRDADAVLRDKSVPAAVRKEIEDVRAALKKSWADLGAEADGDQEEGLTENFWREWIADIQAANHSRYS